MAKYEDLQKVTSEKVEYNEVLEDLEMDEVNLKQMMRESVKEYNAGFA